MLLLVGAWFFSQNFCKTWCAVARIGMCHSSSRVLGILDLLESRTLTLGYTCAVNHYVYHSISDGEEQVLVQWETLVGEDRGEPKGEKLASLVPF